MPAPGRPDAPDHEALVVEGEPRADEGKSVVEEPVMVPKHEPIMDEPVVPECEVVMEEGAIVVDREVVLHESLVVHHAHVAIVHAHSAVRRQGVGRRGGAQGCHRGQSDESDHRVLLECSCRRYSRYAAKHARWQLNQA
jgi:hypothetical protein